MKSILFIDGQNFIRKAKEVFESLGKKVPDWAQYDFNALFKRVYIGFENNPNKGLIYTTNRTILIRNSELLEFEKTTSLFNHHDSAGK